MPVLLARPSSSVKESARDPAAAPSEAELRSLEAASFNPRMLRRVATGARATTDGV